MYAYSSSNIQEFMYIYIYYYILLYSTLRDSVATLFRATHTS